MFSSRMGKSSKATRPVARNSNALLSDTEPAISDSDSDEEVLSHSGSKAAFLNQKSQQSSKQKDLKPSKPSKLKSGSRKVSEPKHMGAKGFKEESRNSLSALDRLVELKASTEEMKIKQMGLRQAGEESQRKFDIAKQILGMDNASDEVKAKANQLLFELMTS